VSYVFIHLGYAYSMPHTPDPARGRTFEASVNHGTIVFLTEAELHRKEIVERYFFFGGPVALAVIAFLQGVHRRPN